MADEKSKPTTVKMKHADGRVADVNNNESVDIMKEAGFEVVVEKPKGDASKGDANTANTAK